MRQLHLGDARGHRFLDQHIHARIEKAAADLRVGSRRHSHANSIHAFRRQRVQIANHLCPELRRDLGRAIRVGIHHAGEFHALQLAPHANVVPAELSRANHGHSNGFFAHEVFFAEARSGANA